MSTRCREYITVMTFRRVLGALIAAILLVSLPRPASAQCVVFSKPQDLFAKSDTVFVGTLMSMVPTGATGSHEIVAIGTFRVEQSWKGEPGREVRIGADRPFESNKQYLVFAFAADKLLTTSILCQSAELLEKSKVKLEWLNSQAVTITPYFVFKGDDSAPAFLVDCRNTTNAGISSEDGAWPQTRSGIRIDGAVLDEQTQVSMGVTSVVLPGGTWRELIELRQPTPRAPSGSGSATSWGVIMRMHMVVPLSSGRHAIAVRCLGVWSAYLAFYWEK